MEENSYANNKQQNPFHIKSAPLDIEQSYNKLIHSE